MKKTVSGLALLMLTVSSWAEPALTIYNQNFAVVRDNLRLEMKAGVNELRYSGTTMHLETDSVVLRDPTGKRSIQILEQNFRGDPISQELLLSIFEGRTIQFEVPSYNDPAKKEIVSGRIVRSGYVPHYVGMQRYGGDYAQSQMANSSGGGGQPIIEVNDKLRFGLPGVPLFPGLPDDTILKPTLTWLMQTDKAGRLDAELSYVTGGMSWEADYNIVAPENGETLDLVGWVTIDNQSGKSFEKSKIKLMAGDVNKIQQDSINGANYRRMEMMASAGMDKAVTEKSFDEYHLYSIARPTTLLDRESKQVEFVRATGIKSKPVYVYDGAQIDQNRYGGWNMEGIRNDREYGTQSNSKIWVMREFSNSQSNKLGVALPKGKLRFYRRDSDGQIEFTGENMIDHTPKDETIRVTTGNSFDIVGSRKRTDYKQDVKQKWADESFEIKLRNHKKTPVEIRVVEHLYRAANWELTTKSDEFRKTDSQTIEFSAEVKPDEEKTITYNVHYTW